jgi:peptidoglycan/LPS O-acetylase OafA/YrhL
LPGSLEWFSNDHYFATPDFIILVADRLQKGELHLSFSGFANKNQRLMPLARLTRRQESNIPIIDGIRAIAILWVIFFHAWIIQVLDMPDFVMRIFNYPFLYWVDRGDLGVDLFFVISGFLIGSIILKEIKSTGTFIFRQFYFRRYLRLTPVYIFAIFLNLLLTGNYNLSNYWSNILYVNNYVPGSEMIWTWSLAMEEQFYLIAPLLLLFLLPLFKNQLQFFVLFTVLALGMNAYYVFFKMNLSLPYNVSFPTEQWFNWFNHYYRVSHLRYVGLLAGVAAAWLHVYRGEQMRAFFQQRTRWVITMTITCVAGILFISFTPLGEWTMAPYSVFYVLPEAVGKVFEVGNKAFFSYAIAFLILACLYDSGRLFAPLKKVLSWKGFYPIAQLSYSAYLFHVMFMFWAFPKLFGMWNEQMSPIALFFLRFVIGVTGTFAMATVMYYLVEQPFMRLRNKVTFKKFRYRGFSLGRV